MKRRRQGRALRRRYGRARKSVVKPQPLWSASKGAQEHADMTGQTWVVVFRPRTGGYDAYRLETLRKTPINEAHEIVATMHPRGR
jgi:hypothetical protein